ncbi:MAG: glycosyltransferase [Muribaculaceae bacterium]|nr:glycosyltransferase [Muribaculaceae bacterium]
MQYPCLISIITASYNCSKFIGDTIKSIQSQTYKNWELIITDDCSTDNSRDIIEKFAKEDTRIKLLKLDKNYGAGVARNNSIKASKGRYIAFCDSDDRWYPNKLERQIAFMKEKDCALSFTSYDVCDENNKIVGYVRCNPTINYDQITRDDGIGCLTAIYDVSKIGKHYMPELRKRQDWCLWIEIIATCQTAYGLQEPLALYRRRINGLSSNKLALLKYNFEVYHSFLKKNKISSFFLLSFNFLPYYFYKKLKQKRDFLKKKSYETSYKEELELTTPSTTIKG